MNPIFIALIVFACLVAVAVVIYFLKSPKGKGDVGERIVKRVLGRTKRGRKYVINDYMAEVDGKSNQIDHILINKNGIFVIETKNYAGEIYGDDTQQEWTQILGKVTNKHYNPVRQNASHVYRLSKLLPKKAPLIPVVVLIENNVKHVQSQQVIGVNELSRFVKVRREFSLNRQEMKKYYDILISKESDISEEEHIERIKQTQKRLKANICPRCNGKLIKKRGEHGEFLQCENYPKCKFTKK